MNIEKEDIITCESYKGLCDYVYKSDNDNPEAGLIHVNMEEIPAFFRAISHYPERSYVVVSSCSDFGLCYQAQHPVWVDMPKWAKMMTTPNIGYSGINIETRCDTNKCVITDKYSVKCYSYTAFTFPEIPQNIKHWFMTNSRIRSVDERITVIPFGVAPNAQNDIVEIAEEVEFYEKEPKMYINWVNYTLERLEIKGYYQLLRIPNVTIVDEAKPYRSYLRDLARHAIILSPEGNGVDCYRNLESIYMGSMPVVPLNETMMELSDLPIAVTFSMYGLRPKELNEVYKVVINRPVDKVKLSYWKERFNDSLS